MYKPSTNPPDRSEPKQTGDSSVSSPTYEIVDSSDEVTTEQEKTTQTCNETLLSRSSPNEGQPKFCGKRLF